MKAQMPAEGILKTGDFGDSKFYHIRCECGCEDCAHEVEIEADDMGISVNAYVTVHTKWWEKRYWKQLWQMVTRGYAEMQSTIVMNQQTALNYSETLKSAIKDVDTFRKNRNNS
jgi:hypothetical protein